MTATKLMPKFNVHQNWQAFINGQFKKSDLARQLINPSDGSNLCQVYESSPAHVEEAIMAARTSFDQGEWRNTASVDRAKMLFTIADKIEENSSELAYLETINLGKALRESQYDVTDAANCFRYYAGLITKPTGQSVEVPASSFTTIVREPIGVCGQIIPWNYPLLMAAWKLAPALAMGNSCVLKPSEYTPLTAIKLGQILQEIGLPPGVVNIVLGDGIKVGKLIAQSNLVDKIAFTGSLKTGKSIVQDALGNLKKVTLELGGKSPMVVFNDFDIDIAIDYALFAIYCHAGQVCSAGSSMIVHEDIYETFIEKLKNRAQKINVGHPFAPTTEMGAMVSEIQMNRVLDYIKIGVKEGAKLITGGKRIEKGELKNGYYIEPTIFAEVNSNMRIVREEIFGPVVVIQKFSDEAQAIALANDSDYGLAGAVFTSDITRAYRVIKALKAGITWINGYHNTYAECPWGGYKQSGWGRELGTFGLEAYSEVKQINLNLDPNPIGWFNE